MAEKLYDYQLEAYSKMHNGCILVGDVGSGKTRTGLYFYYKHYSFLPLIVITTAEKRNKGDWEKEATLFKNLTIKHVDSWNNIAKYQKEQHCFFIFDEAHASGTGKWAKTFLKIAKNNKWIMLSATPADTYMDLWAVFVANGYFKNKTDFTQKHVVYNRYAKFPMIDRYVNTGILENYRRKIYVTMDDQRITVVHDQDVLCDYDPVMYKVIMKNRWNIWEDKPIENVSQLCFCMRKQSNSHPDRCLKILDILKDHPTAIIYYCFDFELDLLKQMCERQYIPYAELNGHIHQEIPNGNRWVYLVNIYHSEAWNCISTDTLIFYSLPYSYKSIKQAKGRINRINTSYKDLYYYMLRSCSPIDVAINRCLKKKKSFNETKFIKF